MEAGRRRGEVDGDPRPARSSKAAWQSPRPWALGTSGRASHTSLSSHQGQRRKSHCVSTGWLCTHRMFSAWEKPNLSSRRTSFYSFYKKKKRETLFLWEKKSSHVNQLLKSLCSWEKWHESQNCSVVSDSLQLYGLYSPWNSPGQNTAVGSHSWEGPQLNSCLQGRCEHCPRSPEGTWTRGCVSYQSSARKGQLQKLTCEPPAAGVQGGQTQPLMSRGDAFINQGKKLHAERMLLICRLKWSNTEIPSNETLERKTQPHRFHS